MKNQIYGKSATWTVIAKNRGRNMNAKMGQSVYYTIS